MGQVYAMNFIYGYLSKLDTPLSWNFDEIFNKKLSL
jgi:hypothetical protein